MPQASIHAFPASYDTTTKVISLLACGLMAGVGLATQNPVVFALSAFIAVGAYAYSPRGYSLDGREIVVHRLIGNVRIRLAGLRQARPATAEDLSGGIRLWGSGGMFGYYGLFRTSGLGKCTWYVTNRRNMVVVETEEKTALFSPDDVARFLGEVRNSFATS